MTQTGRFFISVCFKPLFPPKAIFKIKFSPKENSVPALAEHLWIEEGLDGKACSHWTGYCYQSTLFLAATFAHGHFQKNISWVGFKMYSYFFFLSLIFGKSNYTSVGYKYQGISGSEGKTLLLQPVRINTLSQIHYNDSSRNYWCCLDLRQNPTVVVLVINYNPFNVKIATSLSFILLDVWYILSN